ncbi:MAG: hypothetical protein HYU69_05165 [Bacteroidetes bacterium]|nr:hypothetical protein [Bacteroidota bacterium]
MDFTFIIEFEAKGKDTVLYVTHINVPDKHLIDINKGWHDFYWKALKEIKKKSRLIIPPAFYY